LEQKYFNALLSRPFNSAFQLSAKPTVVDKPHCKSLVLIEEKQGKNEVRLNQR
jgi:hypothetical protein